MSIFIREEAFSRLQLRNGPYKDSARASKCATIKQYTELPRSVCKRFGRLSRHCLDK